MTATGGNRSDDTDAGISFAAERLTFSESFGFPRIADAEDRERFGVRPGDRCLDVGCGTGALMRFLLPDLGNEGGLIGVDHDSDLLAQANEMMDGGNVAVQFQQADALYLPFEDDVFDVVASWFLLCILSEPRLALEEMVRVCRPGGTVSSVTCFCKSGNLTRFYGVADWDGLDRYARLKRRFDEIYRTKIRNPRLGLPNGEDLAVWGAYHEAGLVELRIKGYLSAMAPADADWSDAEMEAYVRDQERRKLTRLDGLSDVEVETLEAHGFSRQELTELRDLTARYYSYLKEEPDVARTNMDVEVLPMVLITGRVPDNRGESDRSDRPSS